MISYLTEPEITFAVVEETGTVTPGDIVIEIPSYVPPEQQFVAEL